MIKMLLKSSIIIGDPWNLNTPDGQNLINGVILKVIDPNCMIFRSNHLIDFDEGNGNLFVLFPRRKGINFKDLKSIGTGISSFGGLLLNNHWDETLSPDQLKLRSKLVFTGSIRLIS